MHHKNSIAEMLVVWSDIAVIRNGVCFRAECRRLSTIPSTQLNWDGVIVKVMTLVDSLALVHLRPRFIHFKVSMVHFTFPHSI